MNLSDKPFDLIVSNFPAKAGAPLLESFIRRSSAHLSPGGRIAIVVVTALAEIVRKTIEETGGTIYHNEKTANYAVFHFRTEPATEPETIEVYIRHRGDFSLQNRIYTLETVYNLPDFDTPGFSIQGAAKLLKGRVLKGNVLFWKPGQGHLPAFLASGSGKKVTAEVTIASNDLLELRITARNLGSLRPDFPVELHHLPYLASVNNVVSKAIFDSFFVDLNPIPGVNWQKELWDAAGYVLKTGGTLCVTGRTSELSAVEKRHGGFSLLESGKFRGFRSIVLKKL